MVKLFSKVNYLYMESHIYYMQQEMLPQFPFHNIHKCHIRRKAYLSISQFHGVHIAEALNLGSIDPLGGGGSVDAILEDTGGSVGAKMVRNPCSITLI